MMYKKSDFLDITVEAGIAAVSLKGSGFTDAMLKAVLAAFTGLKADPEVAGVLITGFTGEAAQAGATPMELAAFSALGQRVMFALDALGKPVIAAAQGPVRGAGVELALSCDFIVAGRSASFAFPGIAQGAIPCFGGTQRLTRAVGKARAKEMIFTGQAVDAVTAQQIGLVNRVCEDAALIVEARELLAGICRQGTLAIRMAKEIVDAGHGLDLKTACLMERDAFALCFATLDQREGMGSFLERRPANFQGR
jgi:enoyl-CoA hydratase